MLTEGGEWLLHAMPVFCVLLTSSESCFCGPKPNTSPPAKLPLPGPCFLGKSSLVQLAGLWNYMFLLKKLKKKSEWGISLTLDSALWLEQREGSPSLWNLEREVSATPMRLFNKEHLYGGRGWTLYPSAEAARFTEGTISPLSTDSSC